MPRDSHPWRQVHLDFHTGEAVPEVGCDFDADRFADTLARAKVNAINLFAKCHHSWSYYPTEVGRPHPNLKPGLDLLGEQIRACHARGIRCPVYYTVGWSSNDIQDNPDWSVLTKDGQPHWNRPNAIEKLAKIGPDGPMPEGTWNFLCPSGDYRDLMLRQTQELLDRYPIDGLWYDICNIETCWCPRCVAGMKEQDLDPQDDDQAADYCVDKWASFMQVCNDLLDKANPKGTMFFNGLVHVTTPRKILDQQSHYELEDLPTVWGGYDKLPPRARYFESHGKPIIAMSGKFHTAWGEFGGYKHRDAMKYEAASMVAFGARCNFGDQLPPSGVLDPQTYDNMGHAMAYVETLEPYAVDATPRANVGVVFSGRPSNKAVHGTSSSPHDEGVCQMLMENQIEYRAAHLDGDLSGFDLLVLTGNKTLTAESAQAVKGFVDGGGKLLVLGESALLEDDTLALDIGAEYKGEANFRMDYTLAGDTLRGLVGDLPNGPVRNYEPTPRYTPTSAEVLAEVYEPLFDRTPSHYTSHQNTPYGDSPAKHAAAMKQGNVVLIASPIGGMYLAHGARAHRNLFEAALKVLGVEPTVQVSGLGSVGRVALTRQATENRDVLHLLYASPIERGRTLIIEDLPEMRNVDVSLQTDRPVKSVTLPLSNETLEHTESDGRVRFTIPSMSCHALVTVEYR